MPAAARSTTRAWNCWKLSNGLTSRAREQAHNLPYGDQRRLEIARAPGNWNQRLLLLDEPAAGMNPKEKAELMDLIRFIRDRFQLAVLLIEHDMKLVMNVSQRRITVLDHGRTPSPSARRRRFKVRIRKVI